MAALISLSLWCIWLSVLILRSAASKDPNPITAESGQNVTLKCQAPNNNILVVEWRKADLKEEYVLLYRDGHLYPDDQLLSFKDRVDLQDRQMKDGDVSVILYNVTINDAGTYECRVFMRGANRRKRANLDGYPSNIITLRVVDPSGQTGGHTEDGGKEAGGKESGSVGLIAGLIVSAVILVSAGIGFLAYRKHKQQKSQVSHRLPAELHIEMSESSLNSESPADEHGDRRDSKTRNCHQHSTRIPNVTLTLENELVCPPQETAGLLPERNMRVQ